MKTFALSTALLSAAFSFSQTDVNLYFPPKVGGNDLTLNTTVQDMNGVEMSIEYFNYYISNVHLMHDGGQDLDLSDTVFIVTTADPVLELGELDLTNIESIDFSVGVPQSLNHEDISQYDESNPLSWQTPSMHWGWSSGYKFLLINGFGDSNNDGTPNELFQIHSLGDANLKNVSMGVVPTVGANSTTVVINCNLDEWMFGFNPGNVGVHHGTTGVNASIMNNVNNRPVFTLPGNANIEESIKVDGTIVYSTYDGLTTFTWNEVADAQQFRLINMNGKIVDEGDATEFSGTHTSRIEQSGSYFFYLLDENGSILKHAQVIR